MTTTVLLSAIGIVLGIAVLFIMAFKGFHNVYVAVCAVAVMALFSQLSLGEEIMGPMMGQVGDYIKSYYLLFLGGAVLGAIYKCTGAGSAIADGLIRLFGVKRANLAIMVFGWLAIMGGIQSFVAIFAVYPIALRLYEKAGYSKSIMPAVLCGSMWTIGHTSPFAPSVPNQIAQDALGTSNSAGWLPGMIFVLVAGALILFYSNRVANKMKANGSGFDAYEDLKSVQVENLPNIWISLLPIVLVFVLYNFVHLDVTVSTWAGAILGMVVFWKRKTGAEWMEELKGGAVDGTSVIISTALVVAVGAVIAETPFYSFLMGWITSINMNPYILCVLATAIFAAVTASGSGALAIVFKLLGPLMKDYAAMGYNLNFIHRLTVQSVSCLDSLPHCGPLIGVFQVCKVSHKEAYKHVFITTIIIPMIVCYGVELPICMILGGI